MIMKDAFFVIQSEKDTARFAAAVASTFTGGLLVGLSGTLGAGKTFFVREFARTLGADPETVLSPTFTLCNEYPTQPKIYHLDFYRVRDEDEYYELGIEEMCSADAIVFIEWADRFADSIPTERLHINIELLQDDARRFELTAIGSDAIAVLQAIDYPSSPTTDD